ncbi:DUF4469 domain-containing protein [Tannerella forsythia]|uniref:DUF4469 domain-containing protein n=1 Tax=Tannerella forsythia TaxID=28112 RepID=UPI00163AAF4A|nr:DUF4469 domain-containing protein [Tannerella forsythia]
MATTEKNKVMVELYDLSITNRKDDCFGRVVRSKTLNEDDPSKITFIVPAAPGDYRIVLTTQFSGTKNMPKEPRICEFEYMLNV